MTTTTSLSKNITISEDTKNTLSVEQTTYDDKDLVKSPQEMDFSSPKEDENSKDEKQQSKLDRKITIDKKLSTAVTEVMNADDAKVATKIENDGELIVKNDLNMSDITKYQVVLNNLRKENNLARNFALHEIVNVLESLVTVPEEEITNTVVQTFVTRSAVYLGDYKILKYGETTAELELHLQAMSSVVYIASRSVSMLEQKTRERLYKSIARFWDASQRTTAKLNPNITFYLREIRCCLKKIKDDQTKLEYGLIFVRNIADAAAHVAIKNYFAAVVCAVKSFSFEYPAGEWYDKWRVIFEEFHAIKQKPEGYSEFWTKLYNVAREEFKQIREKRAAIALKNVKYKVLKRGSEAFFCSLPDNVDTLLIGYLILMEHLLKEFPQSSEPENDHSTAIVEFCQEILNADVKKQLSAKAIELILIIKGQINVKNGSKAEDHLNTWGVGKGKQRKFIMDQIKILKDDKQKILKTIETARADYEKEKIRQQTYNVAIEQKVEIGSHVETQIVTNIENVDTKIEKVETLNVENTTIESQFIENIENKINVENQYVENVETKVENVNVNVERSIDQLVENVENVKNVESVDNIENINANVENVDTKIDANVEISVVDKNVEYVETQYVETKIETQYIDTQTIENVKSTNANVKNINIVEDLDSQNVRVETIENVQTININNYESQNINEVTNINETNEVNNTTNVENINNQIIEVHETIVQNIIIPEEEKRQSHWLDNFVAVIKDVEKRVLGVNSDGSKRRSLLFPENDDRAKRNSLLFSNNDNESKRKSTMSNNDDEAKRMSTMSNSDDEAKRKSTMSNSDDEAKRKSTMPNSDDETKRKSTVSNIDDEIKMSNSDDEAKRKSTLSNNDDEAKRENTSLSNNDEVVNNSIESNNEVANNSAES
ncbi:27623_t:CDS:2 [Dentiscutata erythropus]|uniref:27623_t:CDS:1 n=1 Tax=Dentiscutata erythropus TaxID=1348616 RepID=A0A9N8VYY2_9GLOM|nr:27623_t:CDS:2 [Dentiscutata erythropus]